MEYAERWADNGKHILVSALDATFQRKPFSNVLELIPLAENVIKLTAVCSGCHSSASFTRRLTAETDVQVRMPPGPILQWFVVVLVYRRRLCSDKHVGAGCGWCRQVHCSLQTLLSQGRHWTQEG